MVHFDSARLLTEKNKAESGGRGGGGGGGMVGVRKQTAPKTAVIKWHTYVHSCVVICSYSGDVLLFLIIVYSEITLCDMVYVTDTLLSTSVLFTLSEFI